MPSGGRNKSPESWGWPWVNFAAGSHGRGNNGARMWTLPVFAGTINTHCCQCPPAACRYIGCIGADSSFGRNIIWVKIINERCCLARHILPSASLPPPLQPGNHLLCPSPSFSNKHRSRWRRPGTLALALVIIGQGLIG